MTECRFLVFIVSFDVVCIVVVLFFLVVVVVVGCWLLGFGRWLLVVSC